MFSELGFGELVQRARAGARPPELAPTIPASCWSRCACSGPPTSSPRVSEYHDAGADIVGVVPSTAEDPGGRAVLDGGRRGQDLAHLFSAFAIFHDLPRFEPPH